MNLGWMVWTVPTAIFFVVIAFMLAGMTVWQIASVGSLIWLAVFMVLG
jgi:predicted small integral membrane protein